MAAINPNDLTVALGATPPGTPTSQATFRTTRQILQDVVALMQLHGGGANPNPNPPVQNNPLPVVAFPVPQPRVGGIVMSNGVPTAWVGGGTGAALLAVPASAKAYRSQDLSLKMKTEKACMAGLPESRRLPPPGSMDVKDMSSVISLSDWIRGLSSALKECGLDTVFRAQVNGVEVYLLEKWGKATKDVIDTHVAHLRTLNDPYDMENLTMSGKFLLNSLNDEMLTRTEQELGQTLSDSVNGPDVFRAVIALHSMLNDSTERQFVEKLQRLKLTDEPGEDVSNFSNKVLSIAHHIDGLTEAGVSDLHTLIYTTFDGSSTATFATAVSNLLSQCFLNTANAVNRYADWEHQVGMLKLLYRDLKSRNCWNALHHVKEKVEAQGLVGEAHILSLTAEVQRLTRIVGNTGSSGARPIICHHCGVEGHISPNCPNKSQGTQATSTFKLKQAPQGDAPHIKNHDGKQYKWCGTCKRWNHGEKAHLTTEHVKKQTNTGGHLAPASAVTSDETPAAVVATLTRVSGYFTPIPQPILPLKPNLTRDMHFITGSTPSDRCCIEDVHGCSSSVPGAVCCDICRQFSIDPNHKHTTVHANNLYLFLEHQASRAPTSGFVGSISNATAEEEAGAAADLAKWLIVDVMGNPYCRHCKVVVTDWKSHENTKSHFQTRLLADMKDHFYNPFAPLFDDETEEASTEEANSIHFQSEEGDSEGGETEEVLEFQKSLTPISLKALTGPR